jgi:hypothetical protein
MNSLLEAQCAMWAQPHLSTVSLLWQFLQLTRRESRSRMQITAVAADQSCAGAQLIGVVAFQVTEKPETGAASEVEGGAGVDVKESGAGLTEADLGTRGKVSLELEEELCWKAEKVGSGVVRTRCQLAYGWYENLGVAMGALDLAVTLFIIGQDVNSGGPR